VAENTAEVSRYTTIVFELADHSQRREVTVSQRGFQEHPEGINWDRPFHHKSLVMRFTADWCGYCPVMAKGVNLAMEQHPGKLEAVNIHGGNSSYEFTYYEELTKLYKLRGYPTGYVDGRQEVENYEPGTTAAFIGYYMEETEANYPVSSAIGFTSSVSGRTVGVDLNLFVLEPGSYKVTIMLLENGIVGYQADYSEGSHKDYHHDLLARMSLTDVLGDAFSTAEPFERVDLHYSADVPSQYVIENMAVLVYVQRAYGSQPVVGTNYGGYYVDNAVSGAVGTTVVPAVD
jgi:thiol-disulfide isomerase/thioredoxin